MQSRTRTSSGACAAAAAISASSPRSSIGLHPVGPVLAGMVLHPMANAREVLRFYRDFARNCPDEVLAAAALMTSPEGAPVVAIIVSYIGDVAAGEAVVAPLRKFGSPLVDTIAPTSYVQLNTLFDAAVPYGGVQRYWKSSFLKELGDDLIEILIERSAKMLSPMSMVLFFHLHGAAARVDRNATAFGLRDDQWDYDVISQWTDPAESADHIQWTRRVLDGSGALRDGRSVCQPPRLGRSHADQGRLQPGLRAARRAEEQIRSDEPVPAQPEHQADIVGELSRPCRWTGREATDIPASRSTSSCPPCIVRVPRLPASRQFLPRHGRIEPAAPLYLRLRLWLAAMAGDIDLQLRLCALR